MNTTIAGLALVIFFFTFSAKGCDYKVSKEIRAIRLSYQMPLGNWTTDLADRNDSYTVYYKERMIMYRFPFIYDSVVNGKLVMEENRFNYFVFDRDSGYGRLYDPKRPDISGQRLDIDSVLPGKTFESLLFDTLAVIGTDSLYTSPDGDLIRVYSMDGQGNKIVKYKIYLYYSDKLEGIPETFSKKMDNEKGRKLYKIRGVPDRPYLPGYPVHEIVYKIETAEVEEKELVAGYFAAYRDEKR